MIRIVTFEREYGSGAAEIAGVVAQRLEWKLWSQMLTERINAMDAPFQELLAAHPYAAWSGRMTGTVFGILSAGKMLAPVGQWIEEQVPVLGRFATAHPKIAR